MSKKTTPIECQNCSTRFKSILHCLDKEDTEILDKNKCTNIYPKGAIIFYENMKPFGVHCISKGTIKLYKTNADGEQTILRIAKAGENIGFRALFSDEVYAATGEALEEATVCFIDRTTIMEMVRANPKLALSVIGTLSRELGYYENRYHSLAHKSVRERAAELLLILKEAFGKKDPASGGMIIDVNLSRAEMAQMIGTAQETFIRLLSEFKDENSISSHGRQLIVLNPTQLAATANLDI